MNRYPLWKYVVILVALLIGTLYSLPNFYGEAPAVQVSSAKPTIKVDLATQARVEKILADQNMSSTGIFLKIPVMLALLRFALAIPIPNYVRAICCSRN